MALEAGLTICCKCRRKPPEATSFFYPDNGGPLCIYCERDYLRELLGAARPKGSSGGWIGVDLDGTLAQYPPAPGQEIGEPIGPMLNRVLDWLNAGKDVRVFTARACVPDMIPAIARWCKEHLGREIPITNVKDFAMIQLWDDRAVQVETNKGIPVGYSTQG
jgi:hypothetical protein